MIRTTEGRFAPGHSGNPSGRKKTPEHVKAMLEGLTEKAVMALGDALDGDDPKLKLVAAQEVLNRSLGKPHTTASIDVSHKSAPAAHLEALVQLATLATTPAITVIEGETVAVASDPTPLSG